MRKRVGEVKREWREREKEREIPLNVDLILGGVYVCLQYMHADM